MVIAVLHEIWTSSAATVAHPAPERLSLHLNRPGGGIPDEEEDGHDSRVGDVVVNSYRYQ